jgi:hypothetical protein
MGPDTDPPLPGQSRDQPNHSVTAHPKKPGMIEKDHPCDRLRIVRLTEQSTHNCFVPAWLSHNRPPKRIMVSPEPV